MRSFLEKEVKTSIKVAISFILPFVFLLFVFFLCDIRFQSNDDRFITEILSGRMTGNNAFQLKFVSCLITFPISLLYRIGPRMPIWGLWHVTAIYASFSVIAFVLFENAKNVYRLISSFFLFVFIILISLFFVANMQFSSLSIFLSVTGYVALLGLRGKAGYILFFLFELLGCGVRSMGMEAVQSFGFIMLACIFIMENKKNFRKTLKQIFSCFLIIILVIGINFAFNGFMYINPSWREFSRFEEARVLKSDYGKDIEYEDLKDILEKYEVSEREFQAFDLNRFYNYNNTEFSDDCMRELSKRMKEIQKEKNTFQIRAKDVWQKLYGDASYSYLNRIFLIGIIGAAMVLAILKCWDALVPVVGLFVGYLFDILYLCYKGRFTNPVMMPFYAGVLILFAVYMFYSLKERRNVLVIGLVLLLVSGVISGREQYWTVCAQNQTSKTMLNNLYAFKSYCEANPDKKFVLDMQNVGWGIYGIFDTDYVLADNMMYTGSWYMGAPAMKERYKEFYGGEEFYYMIYEEFEGFDPSNGIAFYAEETGCTPVLYDSFPVPLGVNCNVWKFEIINSGMEDRKTDGQD